MKLLKNKKTKYLSPLQRCTQALAKVLCLRWFPVCRWGWKLRSVLVGVKVEVCVSVGVEADICVLAGVEVEAPIIKK